MIKKVILKTTKNNEMFSFNAQPINIIVGPNNSGKSRFLKEMHSDLTSKNPNHSINSDEYKIYDNVLFDPIPLDHMQRYFLNPEDNNGSSVYLSSENIQRSYFPEDVFKKFISASEDSTSLYNYAGFKKILFDEKTLFLDGITRLSSMDFKRFNMDKTIAKYRMKDYDNPIQKAIEDDSIFKRLQSFIFDAFGYYLEIFLNGSEANFVLLKNELNEHLRLSIRPETMEILRSGENRDSTSDGRKAYLGIISEILTRDPNLVFLDEPEAFLHPPLSRKIGNVISKIAKTESKQIFVSTHSSDFIMGCIESGTPINIIRLKYDNEIPGVTYLDSDTIREIMVNPLLRSTRVIDGIFYKHVIVTESDSDRAFYQEINNRLLDFKPDWGIEDCLFLNAQNKQTVGVIVSTLRKIGVPAVSILDFDMIKDGGNVFTSYLDSVGIPSSHHSSYSGLKTSIKEPFPTESNGNYRNNSEIKTQGLYYLKDSYPDIFTLGEKLLRDLKDFGLFVVEKGELESWLPEVQASNHGTKWLIEKFDSMGYNPTDEDYIKPSDDDIWLFIKEIKNWFESPEKNGMS